MPNIIHVNYPTLFSFPHTFVLSKKNAQGPYVFFVKLTINPSMSQEFNSTIKYRPKLFIGAFRGSTLHWTVVLACEFSSNHSFTHLCGICRVQIKFEGFQHLELAMVALVQLMWLKITLAWVDCISFYWMVIMWKAIFLLGHENSSGSNGQIRIF